jgi:hypothetical protein
VVLSARVKESEMAEKPRLDDIAATELQNRLAKQIVLQIVNEPITAGRTMSDVMMLCESVLVGVVLGCFQLGSDVKVLAHGVRLWRINRRLHANTPTPLVSFW